ncbi:hypothetical protein HY310_02830 [Candidatus Microgenomates bacterium]|nr:hypothetical protein [Candidatus Microgenomates bacterium]
MAMDTKALQLACQFALPPNSLGYCGSKTGTSKLLKCKNSGVCDGVEEELKKFIVLYPYLKTIGEITKKDPFSYEVVEAYCLGNDLLSKVKNTDFKILLKNFKDQGVPDFLIKELKESPPKKFIPTHTFQVLFVGVGKASGSVPFNLETVNNCLITNKNGDAYHWGKKIRPLTTTEQRNLKFWTNKVLKEVAPLPTT